MNIKFGTKKIEDISRAHSKSNCVVLRQKETLPILFSKNRKSRAFFTEDSGLYVTPREQNLLRIGEKINSRDFKKWDSANSRVVRNFVQYQPNKTSLLIKKLEERSEAFNESFSEVSRNFLGQFSMVRLWNLSIIGSILFGMVMMTFIYRYLGQGAAAGQVNVASAVGQEQQVEQKKSNNEKSFADQVLKIEKISKEKSLEKEIKKMVKGYPIEKMVPYIAQKDRTVAAFLVGIAMKESTWGKHVPVLNGQDCYNYWGYRGQRQLMGTGGHTCFNSPKDAVDTVAKRIEFLVSDEERNTPAEMVIWKCGSDCNATGGQAAADKWISDVAKYFNELNDSEKDSEKDLKKAKKVSS